MKLLEAQSVEKNSRQTTTKMKWYKHKNKGKVVEGNYTKSRALSIVQFGEGGTTKGVVSATKTANI